MAINHYENLIVWQKSHKLVLDIYKLTKNFPANEIYGLTSQLRRSSSSICANIVEGHKNSRKEFARFLTIARGSLNETDYHIRLSLDLGYIDENIYVNLNKQIDEIEKMIFGLKLKLLSNT